MSKPNNVTHAQPQGHKNLRARTYDAVSNKLSRARQPSPSQDNRYAQSRGKVTKLNLKVTKKTHPSWCTQCPVHLCDDTYICTQFKTFATKTSRNVPLSCAGAQRHPPVTAAIPEKKEWLHAATSLSTLEAMLQCGAKSQLHHNDRPARVATRRWGPYSGILHICTGHKATIRRRQNWMVFEANSEHILDATFQKRGRETGHTPGKPFHSM